MTRLLFRQRMFSWFDSYDIYHEDGSTAYTVKGRMAWGHKLEIYDRGGRCVGTVKEEVLTFLPRFAIYLDGKPAGYIKKELTLLRPVFTLSCRNWRVQGDLMAWDYRVTSATGQLVMSASKQLLRMTDTYTLDVQREEDALVCLMIVLAIDAAKCSKNK